MQGKILLLSRSKYLNHCINQFTTILNKLPDYKNISVIIDSSLGVFAKQYYFSIMLPNDDEWAQNKTIFKLENIILGKITFHTTATTYKGTKKKSVPKGNEKTKWHHV